MSASASSRPFKVSSTLWRTTSETCIRNSSSSTAITGAFFLPCVLIASICSSPRWFGGCLVITKPKRLGGLLLFFQCAKNTVRIWPRPGVKVFSHGIRGSDAYVFSIWHCCRATMGNPRFQSYSLSRHLNATYSISFSESRSDLLFHVR